MKRDKGLMKLLGVFLLILFSLPAVPVKSEEKVIDLFTMGENNITIYDNWDLPASHMSWTKEKDKIACQTTVTPVTNVSYFQKGLAIDLKSKNLGWDDFDLLKFKLGTDIYAGYVSATILDSDGKYWVAKIPFKGKNKNSYAVKKDAFIYGWGGEATKIKGGSLNLLLISVVKEVKPSQEVQIEYQDVLLVKGALKEDAGDASAVSEWDFSKAAEGDTLGWQPDAGQQLSEFIIKDGALNTKVEKQYAYTGNQLIDIDAGKYRYLVIKMKINGQGSGILGTYFTTDTVTQMTDEAKVFVPITYNGTSQTYALDLNTCKEWKGKVTSFRLDFSVKDTVGQTIQITYIGFKNILPDDVLLVKGALKEDAGDASAVSEWDFSKAAEGDTLGWQPDAGQQLSKFIIKDGALNTKMEKQYAYTSPQLIDIDAGKYRYLVIKMKINGQGSGTVGTYFTTNTITQMTDEAKVSVPITYNGTPQTYILDLNTCKEWKGKTTSFRLDFSVKDIIDRTIQITYIGFKNILPEAKNEAEDYVGWLNFKEEGMVTFETDNTAGYENAKALKIFLSGKSNRGFWSTTKDDFLPSENYKVTGYYRNDNKFPEDGKNLVRVIFLDEDGKEIKDLPEEPRLQAAKEINWKKVEFGFKIPDDAVEMKICLGAEATGGTAWWSKIEIAKTDTQNSALDKYAWQANWIKFPEKYPQDNSFRYFRKEISVGNDIAEVPLQITADDSFWLYLNGNLRYKYNIFDGWRNVQKMDLAPFLKPGKNVIAIKTWNSFGATGLLFESAVIYATGKIQKIVSDDSWKTTDKEIFGWNTVEFNDNGWASAGKQGSPPILPWGKVPYVSIEPRNIFVVEKSEIPAQLKSGEPLNLSLPLRLKTSIKPISEAKIKIWIIDENKIPFWQTEEKIDMSSAKKENGNVLLKFSVPTNNFLDGKYRIYAIINDARIFTESGTTDTAEIGSVKITGNDKKQKQNIVYEVKDFNGIPMIHTNGKPSFLNAYSSYYTTDREFDGFVKDFSEQAGFNLYFFGVVKSWRAGATSPTWIGPNKYDFSEVDRVVSKLLSVNPQAKVVLSYGVDAPEWWSNLHPEELVKMSGEEPGYLSLSSPASALWRKESGEAFRQFVQHVENSSYAQYVIGYRACAHQDGGEWQYKGGWEGKFADYSTPMKAYFQEWLREKYGQDVRKLRDAWNNPNIDFETATIPSQAERENTEFFLFRKPEKCQNVIDYHHCHSDVIADAILFFAKISKEEAPHKLFGVYGSYIFAYTGQQIINNGHLSYIKVYDSPYVDFVSGASDYVMRNPGEPSGFYSPSESLALRGKLWIMEADLRTFLSAPDSTNKVKNLRQAIGSLKREFGLELTRGYGMYWFDMMGGWYDNKGMLETFRKMKIIGDNSLKVTKKYSPEVAVFYSTESAYCLRTNPWYFLPPLVFQNRFNLGYTGTPYVQYYIEDILRPDFPKYKCYIFLNAFNLDENLRKAIKEKLQKDNSVLVWLYAPGFFKDYKMSIANMKELTGININYLEKEEEASVELADVKHPLVEGLSGTPIGGSLIGPIFYADDSDSITLGKISSNGKSGLAIKNMGNWTSIYSSVPLLPEELWRRIEKFSGAHIYTSGGDPLYTDGRFLVIHARTGGEKEIILQNKTNVYDVFTNETIALNTDKIKINIPQYKTEMYFLGEEKEWKEFLGK